MGNYLSAYTCFKNAAIDYPDLPNKEEVEFLVVKSAYLYAKQSVAKYQQERFAKTIEEANNFNSDYPSSAYAEEVNKLIEASNSAIDELKKTENDTSNN
jgi:outer membrane protein assembly factor BamD